LSEGVLEYPFQNWKSLLGFFTEAEAFNILKSQGFQFTIKQDEELNTKVREAMKHASTIVGRRTVVPDVKEIPVQYMADREQRLRNEPTFAEHLIGMSEVSLSQVEIGNLHVFQPNLNMEYVRRLVAKAPEPDNLADLLRFCLPLREEVEKFPVVGGFNPNTNTVTLMSENLDMRMLGQVQGEDPKTGRPFFGFAYGGGLPQISVVDYKGVFMIKNGYHRAFALLEKGHKFMPCLLLKTDNYQVTGAAGTGFFTFELMLSDRSPILSDFQSPAAVPYPRRLIRVVASIRGEVHWVPASSIPLSRSP
jgi:hypothetical protein